ncbi:histone-lysine N-methyltransferase SETMAR [Trichonephila clavipes]|nr:histone-lysine N-methyltransferase SETMAR [Trichonephila clavipes]
MVTNKNNSLTAYTERKIVRCVPVAQWIANWTSNAKVVGKNASQAAEVVNGVYGADTVTANYLQFWFHRFRSGIFDVKVVPRPGRPVVENVDKITEIIEVDRHVSSRSIAQELKIDHKTVLSHSSKGGFKKKLGVWVPHQLTPKNMMD